MNKGVENRCSEFNKFFAAFWLGILNKENLHLVDEYYYSKLWKKYSTDDYNKAGLYNWEKKAINKYFKKCKRLLVAGAGAGREILALYHMGFDDIDGFECNPKLVEFGNELLKNEKINATIHHVPHDQCPNDSKIYDGIIIGWGTYMLIQGKNNRIAFLRKLRDKARDHSPILHISNFFFELSINQMCIGINTVH